MNNSSLKTVILAIPNYVFISDLTRTKYLEYLASKYRVVVLTPFLDDARAKAEGYYIGPTVLYERYVSEQEHFWSIMKELRIACVNEFDYLAYVQSWYKRPSYTENKKRRLLRALTLPFKRFLTASLFTRFERRFGPAPAQLRELIRTHKPAVVLTATPGLNPWEAAILLEAQRQNIPTVAVNFSWDNLTANSKHIRKTDYLIAWNELLRDEAIAIHGYSPEKVFVSGTMRFDPYFDTSVKPPTRTAFLKSKGLNLKYKTIFHTTVTKAYPFQMKYIRDLILLRAEKRIPYVNILIRIHPRDIYEHYREFFNVPDIAFEKAGRDVDGQTEMSYVDLLNLRYSLQYTDLNINYASTISLEASIFDTPIINIGYLDRFALAYNFDHYKPIVDSGAVRVAKNDDELPAFINAYLENPALDREGRNSIVRFHVMFTDGASYKRNVDTLEKII